MRRRWLRRGTRTENAAAIPWANGTQRHEYLAVPAAPGTPLSNGLVVDASITARLLGIRLLKLDAHITLVPADFAVRWAGPSEATASASAALPGGLNDAVDLLARATRTLDQLGRD